MDIPSGQCALEPPMVASEPAEPGARADERSGAEDSPTHIECPCAYEDLTALRKIAARREGGHLDEDLESRTAIVNWIAQVAHDFELSIMTVHMTVEYYDRVRACMAFPSDMLPIVAVSCLLIAAKFEEGADKIPSLSELLVVMGTPASFSRTNLMAWELQILWLLGWNLRCATRLHFLEAFDALGLSSSQDKLGHRPPTSSEQEYVFGFAKFFCDFAAQHPEFVQYGSELAAVACVALSRNLVGIRPVWPDELSRRFGHSACDIAPCCDDLLLRYRAMYSDRPSDVVSLLENATQGPCAENMSSSPTNVMDLQQAFRPTL